MLKISVRQPLSSSVAARLTAAQLHGSSREGSRGPVDSGSTHGAACSRRAPRPLSSAGWHRGSPGRCQVHSAVCLSWKTWGLGNSQFLTNLYKQTCPSFPQWESPYEPGHSTAVLWGGRETVVPQSAGEMRGWSSAFILLVRKQISDPGLHCLHSIEPGAVCYRSILGLGAQCPWLTGLDKHLSYLPTWKWGDMISGDWRVAGQWAYLGAKTWIGRRGQPRDNQGRAFQDGTTWGGWWA